MQCANSIMPWHHKKIGHKSNLEFKTMKKTSCSKHTPMCAKCLMVDITGPDHTVHGESLIIKHANDDASEPHSHRAKGFTGQLYT